MTRLLSSVHLLLVLVASTGLFVAACSNTAESVDGPPTPTVFDPIVDITGGRVVNVLDGVTLDVEADGQILRVKYLGVVVPDMHSLDSNERLLGQQALDFNRFTVEGKVVDLEKGEIEADPLGVPLRYVFVDGEMVNRAILVNGYGTVSSFPKVFEYRTDFAVAQESARQAQRGLWEPSVALPTPTPGQFGGGTLPLPPRTIIERNCDFSDSAEPKIKGNVDLVTGERLYYIPGSLQYDTTVISEVDGDRWFCTESEAVEAGWEQAKRRVR